MRSRHTGSIHLQAEISGQARISVSRPKFRPGILAWKKQAENFGLEFQARIPSRNFQARIPSQNFSEIFFQKYFPYFILLFFDDYVNLYA